MRPSGNTWSFVYTLFPKCLGLVLALLPACATLDYIPPGQGTSADLQFTVAKSLERSMKEIPFDPAGKTVDLHVRALGSYQNALGLEGYVKSLFREWIVGQGGGVGPGEFQMAVFLPVLGNTAVRRDLSYRNIPLYYSERFQTTARIIVVIKDSEGKTIRVWQNGERAADLSDIFLMHIFGPFDFPRQKQ